MLDGPRQPRRRRAPGAAVLGVAVEGFEHARDERVAVVPDAVYELCGGIQAEIFRLNVVLVSYSMFIPYLLLVFQTMLKAGQSLDLQHLDAYLQSAQDHLTILQEELDGRFSKALTMLTNSRDELRTHLSKLSGSLVGLQVSASRPESRAEETE